MCWDEFATLLSGLNEKTPLGRIVSIRAENDPKILKNFTPEQRRIRAEWARKAAPKKTYTKEEYKKAMQNFENLFRGLSQ